MSARSRRAAALTLLAVLAGCGAEKARVPETQAGARAPEGANAEPPADAFEAPREELDLDDREGGDDLDDLLAMEADLGRYEATLWRSGVPVRAYAQRLEGEEKGLGAADDESKDEAERDRTVTATPPASKPAARSGKSNKATKAKPSKKKSPSRGDAAGAGAAPSPDAQGGELGKLAKNDGDPAQRCETVCEVAAAICEIEARVCEMADRHTDDPRYQNACERAGDDCRVATQACQQCSAEQGR